MNQQTLGAINFYDDHPPPADFYAEVLHGLRQSARNIPPKFFYDAYGSKLFDAICELPEYYQTRTEISLLQTHADEIAEFIGSECLLIEPGSGNCEKVRYLLDALQPSAYMPMDISRTHLLDAAKQISEEYPWLDVHATCMDFTTRVKLHFCPPNAHRVAFFPGSSIGNFEPQDAVKFMQRLSEMLQPGGGLLIGVDIKKDQQIMHAAYNDEQGVTAAFNLNLLTRINQELDADFNLDKFRHQAFYNSEIGRIEMHLNSQADQVVTVAGEQFSFSEGESIHTENSYKYTIGEFEALANQAGFVQRAVWTEDSSLFSLHYYEVK